MTASRDRAALRALLAAAGCVAADEEAAELLAAAGGDDEVLDALVARRLTGEPLAWVTGSTVFCGLCIVVDRGVYVPRWQSEPLARRAAELLPDEGVGIDVCCGTGAIAAVMARARPAARVVASDLDPAAVACARRNGVDAHEADLFAPQWAPLRGRADVVTGVVPYVPSESLGELPSDTLRFESPLAYDGGGGGTAVLRRVLVESAPWLRAGGTLLLELGGDQARELEEALHDAGLEATSTFIDADGDVRGIEARRRGAP